MTIRTISSERLIDGAKVSNLPNDTISELNLKEDKSNKGVPTGYASLDANGYLEVSQLPPLAGAGDMTKSVYDQAGLEEQLVGETATQTLSNKTLTNTDSIDFDSTRTGAVLQGEIAWDNDKENFVYGIDSNSVELGIPVDMFENQTGAIIGKGSPIYVAGAVGVSGKVSGAKFIADGSIDNKYFVGFAHNDVPTGGSGVIITGQARIRKLNTSAWTPGTELYPSATVAGAYQTTAPATFKTPIAFVITQHATNGVIEVRYTPGLKNTDIVGLSYGTTSGTTLEGSRDALYAKLTGGNTFSGGTQTVSLSSGTGISVSSTATGLAHHGLSINTANLGNANGLLVYDNSNRSTLPFPLVEIDQDNASSTSTCVKIKNDGTGSALDLTGVFTVNGQNWTSAWTSYTPTLIGDTGSATIGTIQFCKIQPRGKQLEIVGRFSFTKNTMSGTVKMGISGYTFSDSTIKACIADQGSSTLYNPLMLGQAGGSYITFEKQMATNLIVASDLGAGTIWIWFNGTLELA